VDLVSGKALAAGVSLEKSGKRRRLDGNWRALS